MLVAVALELLCACRPRIPFASIVQRSMSTSAFSSRTPLLSLEETVESSICNRDLVSRTPSSPFLAICEVETQAELPSIRSPFSG